MDTEEDQKLALERYRIDQELAIRRDELGIKEKELARAGGGRWSKVLEVLLLALVGVAGAFLGSLIQGRTNSDLEEQKLRSTLILEAIKTGNPETAKKNLKFMLNAGILTDPENRISKLLEQNAEPPVLPFSGQEGNLSSTNVNLARYCKDRFGETFFPVDGSTIYCSDGTNKKQIDRADVCLAMRGSRDFTVDYGTLTWRCTGGITLKKQ